MLDSGLRDPALWPPYFSHAMTNVMVTVTMPNALTYIISILVICSGVSISHASCFFLKLATWIAQERLTKVKVPAVHSVADVIACTCKWMC